MLRLGWNRLIGALRSERADGKRDADLDEEIAAHLEMMTEDNVRAGMTPEEARRAARRTFGHVESTKESYRDQRGMPWAAVLRQDLKYAWRGLRRSPGFALTALLTLGFGLGLCSTLFTILNGVLLKPLPGVPQPSGLIGLQAPVSYPAFEAYRDQADVLSGAAAFVGPVPFGVALDGGEDSRPERLFGQLVSPEYFSTLGVEPLLGRLFDPATERRGDPPVAVMSERFWRTKLNADLRAIGARLWINGREAEIVGVGPVGFDGVFPTTHAAIFVPTTADASVAPELGGGFLTDLSLKATRVIMRPAPGVTREGVATALDTLTRRLRQNEGQFEADREQEGRLVEVIEAGTMMPVPKRQRSLVIIVYVVLMGLILSFTCANLAGVMLARGQARAREIAIRLSVGAHRRRIVGQLLMESLGLAVAGGLLGLACAFAMLAFLNWFSPASAIPINSSTNPDWRVAAVTFMAATLSGVGFGLLPALAASRPNLTGALNRSAGTVGRRPRRFGLRNAFMVYQVAAAMTLLLVMGILLVSVTPGGGVELGAAANDIYVFRLDPPRDGYPAEETTALFRSLPSRLSRISGVEVATFANQVPLNPLPANRKVSLPGTEGEPATVHSVALERIGPDYFSALRSPVLRGREFETGASETAVGSVRPVVLNRTAAEKLYPTDDALGQVFEWQTERLEVIGVVDHGRPAFGTASGPPATIYLALSDVGLSAPPPDGMKIIVRGRPGLGFEPIKAELERIDSRLTPFDARTMRERLDEFDRLIAASSTFHSSIALFAVLLACIGLAGVTAQSVVRRQRELAVRLALGAKQAQVVELVMREGVVVTAVGGAAGFAVAWAFGRVVASTTPEMAQFLSAAVDPFLSIGAPALLATLAMAACYLPAARTASLNPADTLREE